MCCFVFMHKSLSFPTRAAVRVSKYIYRLLLRLAIRRYRAYRIVGNDIGIEFRSLIIEDVRRKRFFEVSHDEYPSNDELEESDRLFRERIVPLSDISICISRLTVDAMLFGFRGLKSWGCIEQAMEVGRSQRQAFWSQLAANPERTHSSDFSISSTYENREQDAKELRTLQAKVELSTDEKAPTRDELFQQESFKLRELLGPFRAYWQHLRREGPFEYQVLTFER